VARYYKEFQGLNFARQYIASGDNQLDSVLISPSQKSAEGKAGKDNYFIFFQGRGEYYESRFRDMAVQAQETGASVLGFNPKGFNQSTGKIHGLSDLVDDGIAVIDYLLSKDVDPKKIILQGNSLGSGVQEMVNEYFRLNRGMEFRQINSNSFKNLASVVAYHYKTPFLEWVFKPLLDYSGWEIKTGLDFYKTGPYRMYLRREGDRTIIKGSQFHAKIDHESDYRSSPDGYKETNKWLNERNKIIYAGRRKKDPHELGLSLFAIDEEERRSVFVLINRFLKDSSKYIEN
jgi:hypothetical protein